jgi:hypothetical protein
VHGTQGIIPTIGQNRNLAQSRMLRTSRESRAAVTLHSPTLAHSNRTPFKCLREQAHAQHSRYDPITIFARIKSNFDVNIALHDSQKLTGH